MNDVYVVACSKVWKSDIAEFLQEKTGCKFILVTENRELNADFLNKHQPKKIFFAHWSYMILPEIFNSYECVIFHMTDLPYGRGGSPLQNLILRGHRETKITALRCTAVLDAGPIYMKKDLSLAGTAQSIFEEATKVIIEMIQEMIIESPQAYTQTGDVVEFVRRKPNQSDISSVESLQGMYNFIRMLDAEGYPPAFIENNKFKIEFTSAQLQSDYVEAKVRIKIK